MRTRDSITSCPKLSYISWWERQEGLTTIDNFAKNCWTVGGRAVPAAVAELPLALLYGSVQSSGDGMQDARILPNQPALATAQKGQAWVQDQLHVLGIGEEVGRGSHIDNTPGATQGQFRVKELAVHA